MNNDPAALDEKNIQKLLGFLDDYDNNNATWENATEFLHYLRFKQRFSFARINKPYLIQLYLKFKDEKEK